ncbi:apical sushi protein, putative [Plasmodium gallinaceum]|uniref:Apical sushi protein, putative n=1 Tax=Plasmodium gallinaceum TaxID=5849 RepID=A0A1J1H0P0_PLAGA|nr:apical sushi protein, putative [Plasmodium gallinaceum]CRG98131.1 apical sushi protein, putative [Plasmodium gallinaceum]
MNIICNILIFLLYYKITKASDKKYNKILSSSSKLKENSNNLDLLNLKKNEIRNQQKKIKIFNELSKIESINSHPYFRSKFSFFQNNDNANDTNSIDKKNDEKENNNISNTKHELIDVKSQLEEQEIIRRGEHFYLNGGSAKYEYNNDEDFFKNFQNNHNNKIEIYSPCFDLTDMKTCKENQACFYDNIYQSCFQNCKLLEEKECLKYTECKFSNNGCENQGYVNLQVFGNDLGSGIRACELFETEESCYLMEKHYKQLEDENKTNFNCMWLSYNHEWKEYEKEIKNNKKEENENIEETKNIRGENQQKEKNDDINYNTLRNDKPGEIAKNEKFLSLLELHLNEKKKNSSKSKSKKKKESEEENDDFDEYNEEENEQNMNESDHDNNNEDEEEDYDEENDEEYTIKKKNKKDNMESNNENLNETKNVDNIENEERYTKRENIFKKDQVKIPETDTINEKSEILIETINEDKQKKNDKSNSSIDINSKNEKEYTDPLYNDENNNVQNEKEISKHDFNRKKNNKENEKSLKVETHICANLNERPNPSILLEGALLAENEAELQKIKKKHNVSENEICERPRKEPHVSLIPDKKYYLIGEKIEFKCKDGYKFIGTTNVAVCIGRNKIMPNITCESLKDFDETEKANIQKINNIISSETKYTFTKLIGFIILILNVLYYL